MDLLHEAIEVLVEDFGAANWEVEYSVSCASWEGSQEEEGVG